MKYNLLIILALLFSSCNQQGDLSSNNDNLKKIKINPTDSSSVSIEDIADSVYFVTLKSDTNFKIQHILNFFLTDSSIIISDHSLNSVFIFNKEGIPKTKINHMGNKPGEYATMADVVFDQNKNQIEVMDLSAFKILRYDMSGKFINNLNIVERRYWGLTFAKNKDLYATQLFFNNKERRILGIYKEDGEMAIFKSKQLIMPSLVRDLDLGFPSQFANHNDSLFYIPLLGNKIYSIDSAEAKPVFQIDVPEENRITMDVLEQKPTKDHIEYWKKMASSNVMYNNCALLVSDKYVSFRYDFKSRFNSRNIFFSKRTGKVIQFTVLNSRINKNLQIKGRLLGERNGFFAMHIHPSELKNLPLETRNNIRNTNDKVIMFFKLKDF